MNIIQNFYSNLTPQQKRIALIIGAVVVILLIVLILWLVFRKDKVAPVVSTNVNSGGESVVRDESGEVVPVTPVAGVPLSEEQQIVAAAKSVSERYGSFSTDTQLENVDSLKEFVTERALTEARSYVQQELNKAKGDYVGLETIAANITITDYAPGSTGATVEVAMRRTKQAGAADPDNFTQKARLQLIKSGDTWLVDAFEWR